MGDYNLLSNTNIYKNTYAELINWVRELSWLVTYLKDADQRNKLNVRRIMELEFDLTKARRIIVEDIQEAILKEYGTIDSEVVDLAEVRRKLPKRGGGTSGGKPGDDYLSDMPWGTEFLCGKLGSNDWLLVRFLKAGEQEGMILVVPMQGEGPIEDERGWMWVDPVKFCKFWEKKAVLVVPKDETND